MADEFTAELEVDGRPIPLDQTLRPVISAGDNTPAPKGLTGLNEFSFTPGAGKDISSLSPGTHTVRVRYWLSVSETIDQAMAYSWTFTAS